MKRSHVFASAVLATLLLAIPAQSEAFFGFFGGGFGFGLGGGTSWWGGPGWWGPGWWDSGPGWWGYRPWYRPWYRVQPYAWHYRPWLPYRAYWDWPLQPPLALPAPSLNPQKPAKPAAPEAPQDK